MARCSRRKCRQTTWAAIAAGLIGVVVALRPEHSAFLPIGVLAVLVAAACHALSEVHGRIIGHAEASALLVCWTTGSMVLFGSVLSAADWVGIVPAHWSWPLGLAINGLLRRLSIMEAFSHGHASAVAPFAYIALAWAVALDWSIRHLVPGVHTLAGMPIVIASGIDLIRSGSPQTPAALPPLLSVAHQVAQHQVGHVRQPLDPGLRPQQRAVEDRRQGVVVAQVEVGQTGDRDVQLHRVDPRAE